MNDIELAIERIYQKAEYEGIAFEGKREPRPDEDYYIELWVDEYMKRVKEMNK